MSVRCVARANPIGMLTRPKLIEPFQMVRIGANRILVWTAHSSYLRWGTVTTASPTAPPAESPLERRTARALWERSVAQAWTTPAFLEETPDGWRKVSWAEAADRVERLARGLLARGVRKGDAV